MQSDQLISSAQPITPTHRYVWTVMSDDRTTFDLIPTVGQRLLFPDDRCWAVSYARLLLDDTMLRVHQLRYGIDVLRECECAHGIDDVQHFFFEFEHYSHIRTVLHDDIMTIWQDSGCGNDGSLDLTVSFLLAPYSNGNLTHQESHKIVSAVFRFIGRASRCL